MNIVDSIWDDPTVEIPPNLLLDLRLACFPEFCEISLPVVIGSEDSGEICDTIVEIIDEY